ncbi:MAG: hypothetical protein R2850_09390 [Bacteroidia bacterium]
MSTSLITEQHLSHQEWLNAIAFYRDELKIMQGRLDEVATRNNGQEVMAMVEHFQNQFIIQNSTLDQLSHDINKHEKELAAMIEANPVASDHRRAETHPEHAEGIETFERIFSDLRKEYVRFLAKVM